MYVDMDQWRKVRYAVLREGKSKREARRETGMHWKTLEKVLQHPEPPGYRLAKERPKPKLGPYLKRIEDILDSDTEVPKKQRHTAKRIFERIAYRSRLSVRTDESRPTNSDAEKGRSEPLPRLLFSFFIGCVRLPDRYYL